MNFEVYDPGKSLLTGTFAPVRSHIRRLPGQHSTDGVDMIREDKIP